LTCDRHARAFVCLHLQKTIQTISFLSSSEWHFRPEIMSNLCCGLVAGILGLLGRVPSALNTHRPPPSQTPAPSF
ncbi:MAG: hypothetical protein M3Y57_01805, partial [Acidobacteriota bacterium]|nr:hypothetical protein [Acidobacteriota bacterium]